jgi:hypothetical protein
MRAVILASLVTSVAVAAPAPKWADWAGSYQGALTWSSCSIAGAKTVTLPLDFIDGVATIDLASTRPGMRAMTLVEDEHGLSGRQGDVAVALQRPRPDSLALAIELDSGCVIRGTLARTSTRVAACDRLLGWARVDARCTKHDGPAEDLAKLLATPWKPADAARCTSRAAALEQHLIEAGCAPHPDPKIGVRSPDCLDLAQVAGRISRCGSVLPDLKQRAVAVANAVVSAAQTADRSTLGTVEQQCCDTRAELIAIATKFGCP